MERALSGIIAGATVFAMALSGCSGAKSSRPSGAGSPTPSASAVTTVPGPSDESTPATPTTTTPVAETTTEADGSATVVIGGKRTELSGHLICSHTGDGNFNIVMSNSTQTYSLAVSLSNDLTKVRSVGLGNIDGVSLSFQEYQAGLEASASRDGNTYTVTGTGVGFNKDDLNTQINEDFTVVASCP